MSPRGTRARRALAAGRLARAIALVGVAVLLTLLVAKVWPV